MRVLYFHQHFSSPEGSAGIRSYGMARRLLERGHSVTMVCGSFLVAKTGVDGVFENGERRGTVDGIKVIELELDYANSHGFIKRSITFLRYALRGIKLIFTENYDMIFATSTPLTAGIPGIVGHIFRRKPFIFEVRDLWPELPRQMGVITNPIILGLMTLLESWTYKSANHVIALSPGIADGIHKQGVKTSDVTLIPNGCDFDIFDSDVPAWRPLEVSNDDFLALFSGTHGIANGLSGILDAAAVLKSRGRTDIKIVLIGQGMLKDQLMKRAITENLDNVTFLSPVSKTKLAGLMKSADIGLQVLKNVSVFYYGTSPNKFFDYIASGLPVLNNYPGWLADMINQYDCGYSIIPDCPVSFADALEHAANNQSDLKIKGGNARSLGLAEFQREVLADRWVNVLEQIYEKYRPSNY